MRKFFRILSTAKFNLFITFLINIAVILVATFYLGIHVTGIYFLSGIIGFFVVVFSNAHESYKLAWLLLIAFLPIFGFVLFFYLKNQKGSRKRRKKWQDILYKSTQHLQQKQSIIEEMEKNNLTYSKMTNYLINSTNMSVYKNTSTKYFADGESYFSNMFTELKKAKHYIFLEYFLIKDGKLFRELFEILRIKAREGVEIKLLYDDYGCLDKFKDKKMFQKLENHGIEAIPFNKIKRRLSSFVNYRNHRKITIIDGTIGFVGGMNISDEYININSKYGYWKDAGLKINGDAVWNLVVEFLNDWQFSNNTNVKYEKYKLDNDIKYKSKEFVQPFGSYPLTNEMITKNTFLNLISNAKKQITITTPYFVVDAEVNNALKLAAKSGVDVKILFPSIPDKKAVYYLGRSYFNELIKAGVKIYQYTPGFVHSKVAVIDKEISLVGTMNFDFRSLYLHFENAIMIYGLETAKEIIKDLDVSIGNSYLLTLKDLRKRKLKEKLCAVVLKVFAPLM